MIASFESFLLGVGFKARFPIKKPAHTLSTLTLNSSRHGTRESPREKNMNYDSKPVPESNGSQPLFLVNRLSGVRLKQKEGKIFLILPFQDKKEPPTYWAQIETELKYRLNNGERFWRSGATVNLVARNRLLDGRQLQNIARSLEGVNLKLKCVSTSRRQTAVAAATAGFDVEHDRAARSLEITAEESKESTEPLYLRNTIRSGTEVRHSGSIILLGDLNPGAVVIAAGDIIIWGSLRGVAHAGANGNREARIMALKMQPTQLRIADLVARAPEKSPEQIEPEIAYIAPVGIRLHLASNFAKVHTFSKQARAWIDN